MRTIVSIAYILSLLVFLYAHFQENAIFEPGTVAVVSVAGSALFLVAMIATRYAPTPLMWPLAVAEFIVIRAALTPGPNQELLYGAAIIVAYTFLLLASDPEVRVEPAAPPVVPVAPAPAPRRGWFGR